VQTRCTICGHPHYSEMMAELKAEMPRTAVSTKYNVDYTALGRCWNEHRAHDQSYEVASAIKRTQKALNTELRKKLPDQNRLLVKDLEMRLKDLRAEQRQLQAIRKTENPSQLDGGETPLTVEAIDRLIRLHNHSNIDGDACIKRVNSMLRLEVPRGQQEQLCKEIEALIYSTIHQRELLRPRTN
jgi:hypothetical protein